VGSPHARVGNCQASNQKGPARKRGALSHGKNKALSGLPGRRPAAAGGGFTRRSGPAIMRPACAAPAARSPDPGPEPDPTPKPTLIYIIFLLPQTASGFRLLIAPIIHPDQKPFIHLQSPLQAGFKASIVIIVLNDVAGI